MSADLEHVCDWKFIIANWGTLVSESRKTIIRSMRRGVPAKYRGRVWALLTDAAKAKENADFDYKSLVDKGPSKSERIIGCDVPRTYPTWSTDSSEDILGALERILNAYAFTDDEIGYTQGMNFIAAMFLLYQDEETAFWSFYSLMHLSSIPHRLFFLDSFPKLELLRIITDELIKERFPLFWEAMKEREMTSTLFAPQWFMVCFLSCNFDEDMSSFIFEQFLAFGIPPLLSLGAAILDLHTQMLKEEGFDATLNWLMKPGESPVMKEHRQRINMALNRNWINSKEYDARQKQALEQQRKHKK